MHATRGSVLPINVTTTSCLLFVRLSRGDKLGEYLEAEGELIPTSKGRIGCEAFPNEVRGECEQAWPRMRKHEFRKLPIQLVNTDQSTLEQRNGDGNVVFTLETNQRHPEPIWVKTYLIVRVDQPADRLLCNLLKCVAQLV